MSVISSKIIDNSTVYSIVSLGIKGSPLGSSLPILQEGNPLVTGGFPSQRASNTCSDVIMFQVALPSNSDTTYWCRVVPVPELKQKHHFIMVRVPGIVPTQNKANLRDLIAATGLTISNWIQIVNFSARVTVKFDGWPRKTIGHLFYATSSFVHHFVAIGEFELELQSGNAQSGWNSTIFRAVRPWNLKDDLAKQ